MSASGGTKAVVAALGANAGIAIAKFVGFFVTGSSSMLAEAVHSVADTANQGLLLLGKKKSEREATEEHPFGFGRERYFYGFVVALMLFSLGAIFAIYEGVEKVLHPHEIESVVVAIIILAVAVVFEGFSLRTAVTESAKIKGSASWWRFIRNAKQPELPVVLLEDSAALLGLVFALLGVGLSALTANPVWDGIGTLAIGSLLATVAIVLIVEMKSLLIGEGADAATLRTIVRELEQGDVQRVIHIRTEYMGPDQLLVAAKIAVAGSLPVSDIAAAIDGAESRIRSAVASVGLIYLEPDLDRTTHDRGL